MYFSMSIMFSGREGTRGCILVCLSCFLQHNGAMRGLESDDTYLAKESIEVSSVINYYTHTVLYAYVFQGSI